MPNSKKPGKEGSFSATEVGALIDKLRSEFKTLFDICSDIKSEVDGLSRWRASVDGWRVTVDNKLVKLDAVLNEVKLLRTELKASDQRLSAVEAKVGT